MAEAMFAKAGRGYNREQVDAFLVELNESFSEKETALNDRIRELTAALAEAEEKLHEATEKNTELEETYSAKLAEKEKECESMRASIGQRLITADARAEEIVATAQAQADTLLANARRRAEMEAERIVSETRRGCAVIGQTAAEFSTRMNAVAMEMRKTESYVNAILEEVRRKLTGKKA